MIKKIINILIVISIFFNFTFGVIGISKKELERSQATQTLTLLNIIKGYEDNTLKLDRYITRAEMCVIIARLFGLEEAVKYMNSIEAKKGSNILFNDVLMEHWALNYINVTYGLNVIKGVGDNKFSPDDNIIYQDLVTMIVRALGYEYNIKKIVNYPKNYLSIAEDIGVLKGINLQAGNFVKRSDAIQLIFNSLTINRMERVTGSIYEPKRVEGKNFLMSLYIDRDYGVLNRVEGERVYINDTEYKAGSTDSKEYIGLEVHFYYVENQEGERILVIIEK